MKKLLLSIFAISTTYFIFATTKIDSLNNVLTACNIDTQKVKLYNEICWELIYLDIEKAQNYADSALELSKKTNFRFGIAESYNNLGIINKNQGNYIKAIEYYNKTLEIQKELKNKAGISSCYNNIGVVYEYQGDYTTAIKYFNDSKKIDEEKGDKKGVANTIHNIGIAYYYMGQYDKAVECFLNAIKTFEKVGYKKGQAAGYNVLGVIYKEMDDFENALKYYNLSLSIMTEIGDVSGVADSYSNIGHIYKLQKKYEKAIQYINESLTIREKLNNKRGITICLTNLANSYYEMGQIDKSISIDEKIIQMQEEMGDKEGIATTLNNIGESYRGLNQHNKAITYLIKSMEIAKELNLKYVQAKSCGNLSDSYYKLNEFKKSYEYFKVYSEIKDSIFSEQSQNTIAELQTKYETEKKEKEIELLNKDRALQQLDLEKKSEEIQKQRILIFSFVAGFIIILIFSIIVYRLFIQKKKANIKLIQQNEEIRQQKEEIISQRDEIEAQRNEIEVHRDFVIKQKEQIEEIHKEVTDSINYAKRIQEAMLPDLSSKFQISNSKPQDLKSEKLRSSEMFIENSEQSPDEPNQNNNLTIQQFNHLNETSNLKLQTSNIFILFKPKDVVSGDFYWSAKVNEYMIYAVADCTGHGVPGAFMSMLGISFLNEIVRKKEVTQASHVLDQLRDSIIDALKQKGHENEQKDGMDISLIAIKSQIPSSKLQVPSEEEREKVSKGESETALANNQSSIDNNQSYHAQWAGANNPLWIVRNTKNLTGFQNLSGLEEVKPDKMPIAIYERMDSFTNHEITLHSDDTIYLMSDGYQDQFGGTKGKKFLSKNLKQLILDNSQKHLNEQKDILDKTIENWKNGFDKVYEQTDDITIIGVKII